MKQEQKKCSRNVLLGIMISLALLISGIGTVGSDETSGSRSSGTVWGTVYDVETNETLADVYVTLYNYEEGYYYGTYTTESGSYLFEELPCVEYRIGAESDDHYMFYEHISLEEQDSLEYDIMLTPYECSVFGYVYDLITREPVRNGAYVILDGYDEDDNWFYQSDYSDENGLYTLHAPPGIYDISAEAENYRSSTSSVTLEEGDEVQMDFYIEPISYICGTVFNSETDEEVEGVSVYLEKREPDGYVHTVDMLVTDEDGDFFFAVDKGYYTVEIIGQGYKDTSSDYIMPEDGHSEHDYYLEIDYGLLSGYVYDQDSGDVMEGVTIHILNYDNWRSYEVLSDGNGYYKIYPGTGDVYVEAYKEGYKECYEMITMEEDIPQELDFYLEPYESSIFGTVSDGETSDPIKNVYVTLEGDDDYNTMFTDENGSYRFYVDAGRFTLKASAEGYNSFNDIIYVESGEELQMDITLAPFNTMVFGYVTNGDGEPVTDTYVRIESEEYYYDSFFVDDEGYYEFTVPPSSDQGEYTLYFSADGYRDHEETFWLDEGEQLQKDVIMEETWSQGSIWRWIWENIFG